MRAGRLFAFWWYALGLLALVQGLASVFGAFDITESWPYVLTLHLGNAVQVVALWALLYYVVYVYTGRRGFFWPLTAFYAVVLVGILYYIQSIVNNQNPSVIITEWDAGLDVDIARGDPILQLLLAALIVPQLGALIAYFTIMLRAKDREQRFRVLVISASLFIWLASSYVASATATINEAFWAVAGRGLAVAAGFMVIFAFRPPQAVRAWIEGVPRAPHDTLRGFTDRVRQLV